MKLSAREVTNSNSFISQVMVLLLFKLSCVIYSPDSGVGFCLVDIVMCNDFLKMQVNFNQVPGV